jgi:hypothetical protein
MLRRNLVIAAALAAALAAPALAQTPPAGERVRIRGTVEKLDGHTLVIASREGRNLSIALSDDAKVAVLIKKSLADIKPHDYIASTGVKGSDGKLRAVEVRIFPEALRGIGEGQSAWDLQPGSVMTNATVTGTVKAENGQVLKVSYKGQESEFIVGPECPVLAIGDGDMSLLKPGAAVFLIALKHPDGSLTSARLYAEKDGVKPPM